MLKRLRIRNLAVVEDVALEFAPGLNVLTGSTGAGKSLILSAVNLLLGERASPEQIRSGESRAEVEASFVVSRGGPLAEHAEDGVVTLRREIRANGRSQAHIGTRAATVRDLHALTSLLIEPHGQNDQFRLRDAERHVEYVDAYARSADVREQYARRLEDYRNATRELSEFERRIATVKERQELLEHRIEELERTSLRRGEKDEIERELRVLDNAERIAAALRTACEALHDDDAAAVSLIALVRKALAGVVDVDEELARFAREVEGADIALRESVEGMRRYLEAMDHDPSALHAKQERLDVLIGLERRYGKPVDALIGDLQGWRTELDGLAFEDERRAELQGRVERRAQAVAKAATRLSDARRKAAKKLDAAMTSELNDLMMKGAAFRTDIALARDEGSGVEIDGTPVALLDDGVDRVRLMVRPNPGESEGGVERIASTGEVSRIALALKKLTNAGAAGSVLIFDEIDAGVGADLGDVIADKLVELSESYQIICITHMPQIAARGRWHLVVSKRSAGDRTVVGTELVDGEARRAEVARMLGGESGSERRLALADELLRKAAG